MSHDAFQFYPTPAMLAIKAWHMFDKGAIRRVLEPSAGRGDLLEPLKERTRYSRVTVDTIELNIAHHPTLREKGYRVVDTDFLNFQSPVGYSHIILNPPFHAGVDHVLHAWDILRDGQIVAILNAETINNPHTEKRKQLVRLIEQFGRVEYVESAFQDPDTLRKTDVRVALVHLKKTTAIEFDVTAFLSKDDRDGDMAINPPQELALPNSTIKNTVRAFGAAVKAMEKAVYAEAEATYYARMIEVKPTENAPSDEDRPSLTQGRIKFSDVADTIAERYDALKEHAWRKVLASADFTSRFSRKVRSDIQQQIDQLIQMEFTVENIYALLGGLIESKTELDYQMLEDIFDQITRYHSDNVHFYRGWKSNDEHKLGCKIRAKRFILPHMKNYSGDGIDYRAKETLTDIDRAFALMDGKTEPDFGMVDVIDQYKSDLLAAKRLRSDYFDIRFYKGIGTVHFFPRRKDLVERLNRVVGRRRQWIPDRPSDAFTAQYEQAEKVTRGMDDHLPKRTWGSPSDIERYSAHAKACADLGIDLALPFQSNEEIAGELTLDGGRDVA